MELSLESWKMHTYLYIYNYIYFALLPYIFFSIHEEIALNEDCIFFEDLLQHKILRIYMKLR